jgi:hypothetical protein
MMHSLPPDAPLILPLLPPDHCLLMHLFCLPLMHITSPPSSPQALVDVAGVVLEWGSQGSVKRKSDGTDLARRDVTLGDSRWVGGWVGDARWGVLVCLLCVSPWVTPDGWDSGWRCSRCAAFDRVCGSRVIMVLTLWGQIA